MNNFKRIFTDIIAYVVVIGGVVIVALEDIPEGSEWYIVVGLSLFAVLSYLIGRKPDGSK